MRGFPGLWQGAIFSMKVLLAVDFSAASELLVKKCAGYTWPSGTIIRVLGVVEKLPPSAAELWYDAAGSLDAVMQNRMERTEGLVHEAAGELRSNGLTAETSLQIGRRRKAIALEIKSWQPDRVMNVVAGFQAHGR